MFIRLKMKEIASLVTDTLIHIGPGLFLLQETRSVKCGDSWLSITSSKEDMGFCSWQSMLAAEREKTSCACKSHWRIFKLNFSKACFMSYLSVCSSCRSFIRVTSAILDCLQCMPWRSFPSEETITADATSLIRASLGWQPVMGCTGCCSRYKMLSCL